MGQYAVALAKCIRAKARDLFTITPGGATMTTDDINARAPAAHQATVPGYPQQGGTVGMPQMTLLSGRSPGDQMQAPLQPRPPRIVIPPLPRPMPVPRVPQQVSAQAHQAGGQVNPGPGPTRSAPAVGTTSAVPGPLRTSPGLSLEPGAVTDARGYPCNGIFGDVANATSGSAVRTALQGPSGDPTGPPGGGSPRDEGSALHPGCSPACCSQIAVRSPRDWPPIGEATVKLLEKAYALYAEFSLLPDGTANWASVVQPAVGDQLRGDPDRITPGSDQAPPWNPARVEQSAGAGTPAPLLQGDEQDISSGEPFSPGREQPCMWLSKSAFREYSRGYVGALAEAGEVDRITALLNVLKKRYRRIKLAPVVRPPFYPPPPSLVLLICSSAFSDRRVSPSSAIGAGIGSNYFYQ